MNPNESLFNIVTNPQFSPRFSPLPKRNFLYIFLEADNTYFYRVLCLSIEFAITLTQSIQWKIEFEIYKCVKSTIR